MVIFDPILESIRPSGSFYERDIWTVQAARQLFETAYSRGRLNRLWKLITRRSRHLLDLRTIETAYHIQARHYSGVQLVSIAQICGSEGRSADFDSLFYPCQKHSQERWRSIAAARLMELALPPVELIQVGNHYFIRDGHHRVSVARALGERYIEAEVTVWQVCALSAGQQPVSAPLRQPSVVSTYQTPG